jgi:hypothetical protein
VSKRKTFRIDSNLQEFMESGVAVIVGTGDLDGRPHVVYGWGPRARNGGKVVDVFLDTLRAEQTLADLELNGRIAMTLGEPVSYRSVQIKGNFIETAPPTPEDEAWVERHRADFSTTTALIGDPPTITANLWLDEVVRVSFAPEQAFDQTPGPDAGKPL